MALSPPRLQHRQQRASAVAPMLSIEQIRGILSEQHAEDLPVAAHMQLWSTDDIRRYAEAGGFWSPEAQSAAAEEAPLGWETYEAHAISLDSPGGEALAAAMSDGWAIRCAQITSAFEPQVRVRLTEARACTRAQPCKRAPSCLLISTGASQATQPTPHAPRHVQAEGSWCGLASLAIVLRALQPPGAVRVRVRVRARVRVTVTVTVRARRYAENAAATAGPPEHTCPLAEARRGWRPPWASSGLPGRAALGGAEAEARCTAGLRHRALSPQARRPRRRSRRSSEATCSRGPSCRTAPCATAWSRSLTLSLALLVNLTLTLS